jgi:hypothetical protein
MSPDVRDSDIRRRRVERLRRRSLLKDVIVFQGKLIVDAFKDLLLGPISLGAAALDLLGAPPRSRSRFRAVMRTGRGIERRLNLFGDPGRVGGDGHGWTVDDVVSHFEASIREQSGDGRLDTAAKEALERTLAGLRNRRDRE